MKCHTVVALLLVLGTITPATGQTPYPAVLYNGASATQEQRLLAMTLAGIVNRDSARLYLLNVYETWSYSLTDERWRDLYRSRGQVVFDSTKNILTLIDRFRSFLNGAITYDPAQYFSNFTGQSFCWQGEQAAVIGALTNRLPVSASLAPALGLQIADSVLVTDAFDGDSAIWVPGRIELSTLPWNNTALNAEQRYLTILDWGVQNLLPRCNPKKFYIRELTDFTTQKRMYQVNLAGTADLDLNSMPVARAGILERVLTYLHERNPSSIFHIYGWIRPEPMAQWFAFFGASFHETLLGNLSWHAAFPVAPRAFLRPAAIAPDTASLRDKYYVLFVGSEGDASNWHMGFQSGAWLSPSRGSVPIGWGWNLHLFQECPFVAAYYYDTATPNDGFLSVTSPLGYAYPDLWQNDVWQGAIDSTKQLMQKFGVRDVYGYKHYAGAGTMVYRGKTISNSFNFSRYGQFQAAAQTNLTILFDPLAPSQTPFTTHGPLMFNHENDGSFYGEALDLNVMAARIIANLKKQTRPGFLLAGYQRFRQDDFANRSDPGSADISVPRLAQLVQLLAADPVVGQYVEAVTPELFSGLMRKKFGLLHAETPGDLPSTSALRQNFPNPFNPATIIQFRLPTAGRARLVVYDQLGREVARLVDGFLPAGIHSAEFAGNNLAAGVYAYRLEYAGTSEVKRMILMK
jgi:hypothetical protein